MANRKELTRRLAALGYGLHANPTDNLGRKWAWKISPNAGGGAHGYFHNLEQVAYYTAQVEEIRSWQDETTPISEVA